jgi:hypothetical protein
MCRVADAVLSSIAFTYLLFTEWERYSAIHVKFTEISRKISMLDIIMVLAVSFVDEE